MGLQGYYKIYWKFYWATPLGPLAFFRDSNDAISNLP